MAIEPLVIDNRPALLNNQRANSVNNIGNPDQQSILDRIKEQKEEDDKKKSSENEAQKQADRVSLSSNALEVLSSKESVETENRRNSDPATEQASERAAVRETEQQDFAARLKKAQEIAVELKGIEEFAKNNDLTDSQALRSESLRTQVSDLLGNSETSSELINDIAKKTIDSVREDVAPILAKISSGGEVTGDEFSKINNANRLLNKANGFGIEGFTNASFSDQQRLEDLKKQSDSFLDSKADEALTRNELDYVQRLQAEISSVQGFRLNIKDTIGPEGVVI